MLTLDLSALLEEHDRAIAEAERALHIAQLQLAHARGRKRGFLETVAAINQQQAPRPSPPVFTNGEG